MRKAQISGERLLGAANGDEPTARFPSAGALIQFWLACTAAGLLTYVLNCCLHFHDEIS
jgi:hypothetical protein